MFTNGISHKVDMAKSGWSIVYMEGSKVIISPKYYLFLSLKIYFALARCVDPDEMPHYHLGLHCLSKYPQRVI